MFTSSLVSSIFFSSELLSSHFWYSDRQTDRWTDGKRRIRAHRALAQVDSKITHTPFFTIHIQGLMQVLHFG